MLQHRVKLRSCCQISALYTPQCAIHVFWVNSSRLPREILVVIPLSEHFMINDENVSAGRQSPKFHACDRGKQYHGFVVLSVVNQCEDD